MAKVAKSVRIDPIVYEYILKYKGDGFNEKFENIILFAMEAEKKKKEELARIQKQIEDKEKQLRKLTGEVNRLSSVKYQIDNIIRFCKDIEDRFEIKSD